MIPSHEQIVGTSGDAGLAKLVHALSQALDGWKVSGEQILADHSSPISDAIANWEARDQQVEARYQQVVQELRDQGIPPDLAAMDRLLKAQAEAKAIIAKAQEDQIALASLRTTRGDLLTELRNAQTARFHTRQQALARITSLLNASIDEFRVKISFEQGDLVEEYETWLRTGLGNRFFRSERLSYFCRSVHPMDLAKGSDEQRPKTPAASRRRRRAVYRLTSRCRGVHLAIAWRD